MAWMADIALSNAYVLFCKKIGAAKSTKILSKFLSDVAERILRDVCIPDYQKRGRTFAPSFTNKAMETNEYSTYKCQKNPQRRCKLCAKQKKRNETMWECPVALHIPDCLYIILCKIINKKS
uniref:Uncharacterized protein n=1 Tax=Vespula pensylvanica TaxID=30213 RepID=A0A834JZ63_VESPE|nr:hypothetical protein H0235_016720 [Vespula pensylvanica]